MNSTLPVRTRRQSALGAKAALFVILASETFFFGTLLSAYIYMRLAATGSPLVYSGGILIPVVNTLILLATIGPVFLAGRDASKGHWAALQGWLLAALAMGLIFVGGQVFEFIHSGMRPNDATFGGVFFTLMGFHALHMLAGVVVLAMLVVRTRLGDFTPRKHIAIEVGSWFWYYVVGVWVVLFCALYLI